jgi:hypothetical protein
MNKKIIEIDFDDPSDLKRNITKLQKRRKTVLRQLGYDQIHFNGSKYNLDTILPIMKDIYNFKLPGEYDDIGEYYIYFHCNPLKPLFVKNNLKHLFISLQFPGINYEPFYVGKGKDNRAYNLARNDSHRKIRTNIIKYKKDIEVFIAEKNLNESKALAKEAKLIDILGLQAISKYGLLCNLDEGFEPSNRRSLYADNMKKLIKRNGFTI